MLIGPSNKNLSFYGKMNGDKGNYQWNAPKLGKIENCIYTLRKCFDGWLNFEHMVPFFGKSNRKKRTFLQNSR